MKIEVKNIKHYASMSEETFCYEGTLWVDGVRLGRVSNNGHGGADRVDVPWQEYQRVDDWVKDNLTDKTLEVICHDHVAVYIAKKDLTKALKKEAVFTVPGQDGVFGLGYKGAPPDGSLYLEVMRRNPGAQVLNTMPHDIALQIYLQARFG